MRGNRPRGNRPRESGPMRTSGVGVLAPNVRIGPLSATGVPVRVAVGVRAY
jgi:hypothetical protein